MNYDTLQKVILHLREYEEETGLTDIKNFGGWLVERYADQDIPKPSQDRYHRDIDSVLAMNIGVLFQHAKHYIKTALKDTPLKGIFDFMFLATLIDKGDLRKSDLINFNMAEFSPGMEVIRRLIRNGLIRDYDDPEDGRSRKVRITGGGRSVFQKALGRMRNVNQIVVGNLSETEKYKVLAITQKLVHFHQPIWSEDMGKPLEDIIEKYGI